VASRILRQAAEVAGVPAGTACELRVSLYSTKEGNTVAEGVWQMESFTRGEQTTAVRGVLFLTAGRWSTLYFVPAGEAGHWGSGESGRYELSGDQLTFFHQHTFQGGGGRDIVMNLDSHVVERCRIECDAQHLTIFFPSGSIIRFTRASA
jgi:hypothetical protein